MSDAKSKSTMRRLLESGPTDPLMMEKLTLLEALQAAHAQGDQATMLEIGRKLADNAQRTEEAQKNRRARMRKAVTAAKRIRDPDERTTALLSAFALCVKEACAADNEGKDIPTYNFGVKRLCEVSDALKELDRFEALAQFLDSPDVELRGFAAVWLRNLWPERILPMLQEINETESFVTGVGTQVYIAMRELEQVKEKAGQRRLTPQEWIERLREILNAEWDSIGGAAPGGVKGEYDSYVSKVASMIREGATDKALADYLYSVEIDLMGLKGNRNRLPKVLFAIRALGIAS